MRTYTILPKTGEWKDIPAAPIDTRLWTPEVNISATAQVCYDADALYLRLAAKEKDIRAEENGPLGMPCQDSCLEFFFSPMEEDPRYFNFEFNPLKALYLGFGAERSTRVRQIVRDVDASFAPKPFFTEDGWGIEYRIPLSFMRVYDPDFEFYGKKYGNFYKCGDLTEVPHYLAWSPLSSETPDYHRRQDFGVLLFED